VAGNPRIEFVLEAIQAALAIMQAQPASPESDRLLRDAASLRQAVEGWRRAPPSRALREETMKRVLRLHVGAATLARLGPSSAERSAAPSFESAVVDENDRPTAPPTFDLEAFARETSAPDSERHMSSEPPTQPWQGTIDAEGEVSKQPASIEREVDRALESLDETAHAPIEPVTARRPSLSLETPAPRPVQRTFSPSSIERALLGAVDGPVVTQRDIQDPEAEMLQCYERGDYAEAISLADLVLADAPESLVALECRSKSGTALEAIYAARLGSMSHLPIVVMTPEQLDGLEIDHRAGFLLSLVDGASTLETILDMCGMPRLDALRILRELVQLGVIRLR
jgi:hypothetical protein